MSRFFLRTDYKKIGKRLVYWYQENRRDLPWRKTKDPYLIWVSESILQQTRVVQGLDYYKRFTDLFPDIYSLAAADADKVMKAWQGLGYYSRARNLHESARDVVKNQNGIIPLTYSGLLKMKGVGPYIAAAIASFAFNERIPVIDGNVIRFVSRLAGIYKTDRKIISSIAIDMMHEVEPYLFNQAIMEFGALQCIPGIPRCFECIFSEECFALKNGKVGSLPVKKKRPVKKNRYFHYFVIIKSDGLIMKKRDQSDIWKGLYDFPLIQATGPARIEKLLNHHTWSDLFGGSKLMITSTTKVFRHILTHQVIHAKFYLIYDPEDQIHTGENCVEIPFNKVISLPVPRLIENFMKNTPNFYIFANNN